MKMEAKEYETLRDRLICGRNDEIDNAAFGLICAVAAGRDETAKLKAAEDLVKAVAPEAEAAQHAKETLEALEPGIKGFSLEKDENGVVIWDMRFIGQVTEAMESELDNRGMHVCHPFFTSDEDEGHDDKNYDEDNDGILCCLSCDRCPGCTEKQE